MRDGAVGRQEGQHGAHVGVDHAAALADAAQTAGLAAGGELDRRGLGLGIGRHNGEVGLLRTVAGQRKLGQVLLDALDRQALANHAGRGDDHVVLLHAEALGRSLCHAAGVLHAVRRAGVGVARVGDDRARHAVFQMLHGDIERRGLDAVHGVDRCGGTFAVAENDSGVILRAAVLDAAADAARGESLCGAHAAVDDLHRFLPIRRGKRPRPCCFIKASARRSPRCRA